jgi:hypothetical protein
MGKLQFGTGTLARVVVEQIAGSRFLRHLYHSVVVSETSGWAVE